MQSPNVVNDANVPIILYYKLTFYVQKRTQNGFIENVHCFENRPPKNSPETETFVQKIESGN